MLLGNHTKGKSDDDVEELHMFADDNTHKAFKMPKFITKIFKNLKILEILYLKVESLNGENLKNFNKLEKLDLRHGRLTQVSSDLFEHVANIRVVDFSKNNLIKFGLATFLRPSHLEAVNLFGNPCNFALLTNETIKNSILSSKNGENIIHDVIQCEYGLSTRKFVGNVYQCHAINTNTKNYIFDEILFAFGDHLDGRTDSDVKVVSIRQISVKIFPQNLQNVFLNLLDVQITNARLKEIPVGSFVNLTSLIRLDLSNNNIQELPEKVFEKNLYLIYVNFENNFLKKFYYGDFKSVKFAQFYGEENCLHEKFIFGEKSEEFKRLEECR